MEKFRASLKKRMVLFAALFLVSLALFALSLLGILSHTNGAGNGFAGGFLNGLRFGGFFACCVAAFALLLRSRRALASPQQLEKMYIEETDERAVLIRQKVGGLAYFVFNYALLLAVVIASYFNLVVALTILCVATVYTFMRLGMKIYYTQKYTA